MIVRTVTIFVRSPSSFEYWSYSFNTFMRQRKKSCGSFTSKEFARDIPRHANLNVLGIDGELRNYSVREVDAPSLDKWIRVRKCTVKLYSCNHDGMEPVTPTVEDPDC